MNKEHHNKGGSSTALFICSIIILYLYKFLYILNIQS